MSDLTSGAILRRVREAGEDAAMVLRLTRDLPPLLRTPIRHGEAKERVLGRIANRERRLIAVVERGVYGHPSSPYLKLLRHVGCELGDFRAIVHRDGVEGALRSLADQGVYLTFEELKGRRDTIRGSLRLTFRPSDFDSPLVRPHLVRYTGGSGGRPARIRSSLAFLEEWAVSIAVALEAHGVRQPRMAFWWPAPAAQIIICGMLGYPVVGWFYPVQPLPLLASIGARYLSVVGRLAGVHFPLPVYRDLAEPERLVGWLADQLRTPAPLVLWTMPSAGARLAAAASAAGLDLHDVIFRVGGEPVTPARRRQMEASGARVVVAYSSVDLSIPSYSCASPTASDDLHVMLDRSAVIQRSRTVAVDGQNLSALLVTSLSPAAARITLNCETGDYAQVEERDCGCLLGELGLRTHLSEVRSFEKLSAEGATFIRSHLERVLEEVLPAGFGGTSLDYQLAEEETPDGATRLVLRVSPSVGAVDEAALRAVLLDELGRSGPSSRYHAELWRNAGTIEIRREQPSATRAGKVLPLHLLQRTGRRP